MKKTLLAKIILLITTVIWGSSFFILKNTLDDFPTFFVLAIRFSLSAVIIGLVFIKKQLKLNKKVLLHGVILGATVAAAYALQTIGLKYTTPAKNAFLTSFYVVLVPILGWILLRKRPKINNIIAAVLCIVGIGCVSLSEKFSMGIGDGLTIACGLFYALQIIFIAKYARDDDPMQLLFIELATIGIIFWIVSLSAEKMPQNVTFSSFLPILYLAVVATALAQMLQIIGQKYASPNSAAIILSLESVFGTVFSVIFYKEILTLQTIIGFCIIFIAVLIGEIDWNTVFEKIKKKKTSEVEGAGESANGEG